MFFQVFTEKLIEQKNHAKESGKDKRLETNKKEKNI